MIKQSKYQKFNETVISPLLLGVISIIPVIFMIVLLKIHIDKDKEKIISYENSGTFDIIIKTEGSYAYRYDMYLGKNNNLKFVDSFYILKDNKNIRFEKTNNSIDNMFSYKFKSYYHPTFNYQGDEGFIRLELKKDTKIICNNCNSEKFIIF